MPPARIVFWAATLGGIVLASRSVLAEPPPLALSVLCAAFYVAIIGAGVFVVRLRMFADAIVNGPVDARGLVLTFDDASDLERTRALLDALEGHGAQATFFVTGEKARAHPGLVARIVDGGHEVGLHDWALDASFALRGPRRVRRDLERAVRVLEEITGKRPVLFRPPMGRTSPTIARIADQLDLTVVGWSVAAEPTIAEPKTIGARARRGIRDGAIVLVRDATLPEVLDVIEAKNLRSARLGDWVAAQP